MEPPFIKSIATPDNIPVNTTVTISVQAEWPNPAWSHSNTQIQMNEQTKVVKINYMGQRSKGMAIMKIISFSFDVELKFPVAGEWVLKIANRGDDFTQLIKVE